jgi:pimeloyl-ACP methyl ester carboxylesterase
MMHAHVTAPTQYVQASGIRFAYRRFGQDKGVPLVLMPHYRAGMDHWDPAVTDGLAASRPVILFDNAGIAASSGKAPNTMEEMADHAADFVAALGLSLIDVLGFSIGGYIAQTFALRHPDMVRRLMLVGTGPRGGEPASDPNIRKWADLTDAQTGESPLESFLYLFFRPSETSQAAGREFLKRFRRRTKNRDPEVNEKVAPAQIEAISKWGAPQEKSFEYLKSIHQPTLVVNGGKDVIIYSVNSFILQQRLPNAQLILYPDANHGSQYQYPELFVRHVSMFLSADER